MNPLTNVKEGNLPCYWDIDNQLSTIGVFKELYEGDKSKKKVDSSLTMWAVAFFAHPDSRLYNLSTSDRKEIIETDVVKREMNWIKLSIYIDAFRKLNLTQLKRSLEKWKDKLEERDDYLTSLPYKTLELKEATDLDKLIANTPKLFQNYMDIQEMVNQEDAKTVNKAGIKESAAEKKLL